MAQPANTFSSYDAIGNREDLTDIIYDISPTDTPFMSYIARAKASATLHEWQTDALEAASANNAVIEGDDATTDASIATVRLGNYTQISDKVARTTGTQDAVDKAGRQNELDYQVMKRGKELKRDMESSLTSNNASVAGNDTTARVLGGYESWVTSNVSRGAGGANGGFSSGTTTAATDGTQRAFTEALLKTVLQSCWDNGGEPDCIMAGSFNKQIFSTFTGGATAEFNKQSKKIVAAIDVYVSDFGTLKVYPNRFQRDRSVLVVQKDMWATTFLRPIDTVRLAKTGDSERKQIITEYTLESRNEKSSGIIADLTTS